MVFQGIHRWMNHPQLATTQYIQQHHAMCFTPSAHSHDGMDRCLEPYLCEACSKHQDKDKTLFMACGHYMCYDCFTVSAMYDSDGSRAESCNIMWCLWCKIPIRYLIPVEVEAGMPMEEGKIKDKHDTFPGLDTYNTKFFDVSFNSLRFRTLCATKMRELFALMYHAHVIVFFLVLMLIATAYFVWAEDVIPDYTPSMGYLDDVLMLFALIIIGNAMLRGYQRSMVIPGAYSKKKDSDCNTQRQHVTRGV